MSLEWIKKRWFLLTFATTCIGLLLGGAKWASKVDANDVAQIKATEVNTDQIRENKKDITRRLERIESKVDRLIERGG